MTIKPHHPGILPPENDFNLFFDLVPDMIVVASTDGYFKKLNKAWASTLGFTSEELMSKPFTEFIHPDDVENTFREVEKQLKGQSTLNFQNRYLCKNGEYKWLDWVATPSPDGKSLYATARDITEKKQNRDELKLSEERFSTVAKSSGIWIWEVDAQGRFTYCSESEESILGYLPEEIVGKKYFYDFFAPEVREELKNAALEAISNKLLINNFENPNIHKNGSRVILETTGVPLLDEHGKLLGYRGADKDITERKRVEKTLNESEEKFRKAFFTNPDAITLSRLQDGIFISANFGFENIFGYTEEEVSGKSSLQSEIWEEPEARARFVNLLQSEGSAENFEARLHTKSEKVLDCLISAVIIELDGINHVLTTIRDISGIKLAGERLKESENRFGKIYEEGPFSMALVNKELKFQIANEKFCRMLGYREEELQQLTVRDITFKEGSVHEAENIQKLLRGEISTYRTEKQYLRKDKSVIWGSLTSSSNFDVEGKFLYTIVIIEDITRRKLTEEALEEAYQRLELATDVAGIGIWDWDIRKNELIWDRQMYELYGTQPDDNRKVYDYWLNGLHPDDRQSQSEMTQLSLWDDRPYDTEFRVVWPDKSVHWLKAAGKAVRDPEGQPVRMVGVNYDVTGRKRTEEKLRQNEEKYRFMFLNNPQPMWIYDLETQKFLEVNNAAILHYGYTREEFLKMTLKDIHPKEDISAVLEDLRTTTNTINIAGEWRHKKKSGEIMLVEIYSHSITYGNRKARHVLVNDVTKRKNAGLEIRELNTGLEERIMLRTAELAELNEFLMKEIEVRKNAEIEILKARAEAEQANMAKSKFLSRMSHELRTPMNSILGFAQLLEMGDLNTGQKKGVNHILSSGKHLLNLINEVLDISRIESGRLTLSIEPVKVSSSILEVMDSIHFQASRRHLNLTLVSSESNQLFVRSDRQRMKQVLLNLVGNAVKYNSDGGSITIETRIMPADSKGSTPLRISITDTGEGIAEQDLPRLFVPFERIGAEKTATEGTGLGLAVVSSLMESMEGKYGVDSVPGKGSTFWIEFPVVNIESIHAIESEAKAVFESKLSPKKGLVYYIEDTLSNIDLVQQILTNECPGVRLITETEGKDASTRARQELPDLILLDLNLPDINGTEVLRQLKEDKHTRSIPVVIISADAMPAQQKRLLQLGAARYLTKPLDVIALLKVIDEFIS